MFTIKEVKDFLNKELVEKCIRKEGHLVNVFGHENGPDGYGWKYRHYYKKSFSVKYDWVNRSNIPNIIRFVKESKFGSIIKCSTTVNGSHVFEGVVFNVKYADLKPE